MKKLMLSAALLFVAGFARATAPSQPSFTPAGSNPVFMPNAQFYGVDKYYIESSTAADVAVLMFAGTGYYYGMSCDSGTAGDYAIAMDSAVTSGIAYNTVGKALGVRTLTSANGSTTCTAGQVCGQSLAVGGAARIKNGLVAIKHGTGANNCVVYALADATIVANPQTH